ncbi:MAG: copper chaperone PCu(A)C [Pseudomonadota bacterium]
MRGLIGVVAAGLLVAGCQQKAEVTADGAWVRLPAVAGNPGSAYFTLHGGSEPATLLAVSAPFAVRTELHESMKGHEGMTSMAPVTQVAVAPKAEVRFAPGGKHVMLYDVAPTLQPGAKAPIRLTFADGRKFQVDAVVVGAGDPEPK